MTIDLGVRNVILFFLKIIVCNFLFIFLVYLRTDPEVAYQRIKTRNRSEEKDVPFEYIKNLHELHDKWLNVHKTDVPKNIPVRKLILYSILL